MDNKTRKQYFYKNLSEDYTHHLSTLQKNILISQKYKSIFVLIVALASAVFNVGALFGFANYFIATKGYGILVSLFLTKKEVEDKFKSTSLISGGIMSDFFVK